MSFSKRWAHHSFFIEGKPRSDLASLFLEIPPEDPFDGAVLDIGINYIDYGEPVDGYENIMPEQRAVERGNYRVSLEEVQLSPLSFGSGSTTHTKSDLFMCKLKAHFEPQLMYRTNHQIAEKALSVEPLKEFTKYSENKCIGLVCAVCENNLMAGEENISRELTVGWVPTDEWMTLTPALDYYCRETCGSCCDPHKHEIHKGVENESIHDEWKPTKLRIMISHTTFFVRKEIIKDGIKIDTNVVSCNGCGNHLGQRVKGNNKNILQFYHSSASILCDRQKYLNLRYPDRSVWFSQQLLIHYEIAASQKLVYRTLNREPILLIWILDSYVSIIPGQLKTFDTADSDNVAKPIPALKLLFKIFDTDNANSDPRANGEDSSVGIVDLPRLACEDLKEVLLRSSLSIPSTLRSLGQFYVAYLPLPNNFV